MQGKVFKDLILYYKMPFIIFKKERDFDCFDYMVHDPDEKGMDGWITGLEGRMRGNWNFHCVYILSEGITKKLDEKRIKYKKMIEEEAIGYMSEESKKIYEDIKKSKVSSKFIV